MTFASRGSSVSFVKKHVLQTANLVVTEKTEDVLTVRVDVLDKPAKTSAVLDVWMRHVTLKGNAKMDVRKDIMGESVQC